MQRPVRSRHPPGPAVRDCGSITAAISRRGVCRVGRADRPRGRPWTRAAAVLTGAHVFYELGAGVAVPLASRLGVAPAAGLFAVGTAAAVREAGRRPPTDRAFGALNGLYLPSGGRRSLRHLAPPTGRRAAVAHRVRRTAGAGAPAPQRHPSPLLAGGARRAGREPAGAAMGRGRRRARRTAARAGDAEGVRPPRRPGASAAPVVEPPPQTDHGSTPAAPDDEPRPVLHAPGP